MTCARWVRVFSVLSLLVILMAPSPAEARSTPGPAPTPPGSAQDPLATAFDGRLHIVYANQTLDLSAIENRNGDVYVDLTDAGLTRFFSLYGVTTRWSDNGPRTLTLYGGGHYLHWPVNATRGLVDSREVAAAEPAVIEKNGLPAISMRALAQYLNFRLHPGADKGIYNFVARLEKVELRNTTDREVTLHASGPLDAAQVASSGQTTTIRMTNVEWAFDERSFVFGDVRVECSGSGSAADPALLSVTVPPQWKPSAGGRLLQNELGIRVIPDFQVQAQPRAENLTNLKQFKGIGDYYVMMDATGPVKQLWRYDADHRVLTVDVPQATLGESLTRQVNAEVERIEGEDMHTGAFPFARLRLTLKEGYGFEVRVAEDNRLTIRVAPLGMLPITAMSGGDLTTIHFGRGFIVIDPGHGGSDPGAINHALNLCEKDVTLDISRRLKASLEQRGFRVVMTREDDRDVSWAHSPDGVELGARVDVANKRNADLFVSIHCNSAVSSEHTGTSYHWFKPQDLPLARALNGSLAAGTGFPNHGPIRNRFYVLRRTTMPAVLVETAFISNPNEAGRLADPAVRQKIADNIAEALSMTFPAARGESQGAAYSRRP